MKQIVKFVKPWRAYQPGEKAGFDAAMAADLIRSGKAVDPRGVIAPDDGPVEDAPVVEKADAPKKAGGKAAEKAPGAPPAQGAKQAAAGSASTADDDKTAAKSDDGKAAPTADDGKAAAKSDDGK